MRKNRAIESQHGADLSRVGRNDNVKGKDEVLLNEMDWKKKRRKAKQDGYRSTAETQLQDLRNIKKRFVSTQSPWNVKGLRWIINR